MLFRCIKHPTRMHWKRLNIGVNENSSSIVSSRRPGRRIPNIGRLRFCDKR